MLQDPNQSNVGNLTMYGLEASRLSRNKKEYLKGKLINMKLTVCLCWRDSFQWARTSSFTRFLDHTQRRITVGRNPLDE